MLLGSAPNRPQLQSRRAPLQKPFDTLKNGIDTSRAYKEAFLPLLFVWTVNASALE
jgi:hypothetical protein